MEWGGVGYRDGMEWGGVGYRDGMEWDGVGWNGMGWGRDGMEWGWNIIRMYKLIQSRALFVSVEQ